MLDVKHKRDPARLFLKRLLLIGLAGVVLFVSTSVWNVYQKERESRILRTQAEGERDEILAREVQLKKDIEHLSTNRGKEEALREQYALAAEGENLIIIVDPRTEEEKQATSTVQLWLEKLFFWR